VRVRVLLQITGDDGITGAADEVAVFEKVTERAEDLGLSIAEGKATLAAIQRRTVTAQAAVWAERHRRCEDVANVGAPRAVTPSPSWHSTAM
jgi:hypothetical protein